MSNQQDLKHQLVNDARELQSYIVKTRRYLHMNPETMFEEVNTSKFIADELKTIGYDVIKTAGTGIIATIPGVPKKDIVALRADIDALNVTEENDVPYKSRYLGKMHACGHDAHTAMLLGAARIIFDHKEQLTNGIKLIFQPGEEGGAGAKKIVEEGHLDDVKMVFGIHIWQGLPSGVIGTRCGSLMASSDRFRIVIRGKGGHAAAPHQTIDPTAVAMDIYNAFQKLVSREVDPFDPCVLTMPVMKGSDAHNIIPDECSFSGTLRTLTPSVRDHLVRRMREIVKGYSTAWRCSGEISYNTKAYPAVINDCDVVNKTKEILKVVNEVQTANPTMVGEDFAFYLKKTKGVFLFLGTYNEEKGVVYPHHHSRFNVDEDILWRGAAVYSLLGFYWSFINQ